MNIVQRKANFAMLFPILTMIPVCSVIVRPMMLLSYRANEGHLALLRIYKWPRGAMGTGRRPAGQKPVGVPIAPQMQWVNGLGRVGEIPSQGWGGGRLIF